MTVSLKKLMDDYWQFILDENPDIAFEVNDPRGADVFYRHDLADLDRQHNALAKLQDTLDQIDATSLSGRATLDHALLARELSDKRAGFVHHVHLRPEHFPFCPAAYIAYCISATVLHTDQDTADYVCRLESLPAYFAAHEARLMQGATQFGFAMPDCLIDRVIASAKSFVGATTTESIWMQPLSNAPGGVRDQVTALIDDKIRPAYQAWIDLLDGQYRQNHLRQTVGLCDEAGGADYYRHLVRHHTGSDATPEQVHDIGIKEVARLENAIEKLAARAGYEGRVEDYRHHLNTAPEHVCVDADSLREKIEVLAKRIDRKIPELFGHVPRSTYGVELIPLERSPSQPGAYAQPAPASGDSAGIFWLNSLPDRVPQHMHIPLTLHEAWPGHLMHVALIHELEGIPTFARHDIAGYMAYIEGWALYCERLGDECGFIEHDWQRFGVLEMELFRAIRLVVDTGLHHFGWTRQQAIDYVMTHQPQSETSVAAEIDRYIGMPGQALAYKMGELTITRLRAQAEERLGPQFRLRDFHDAVMASGPVTLTMLDDHICDWIERNIALKDAS
ncbi:MAG: DUF885 domain-containing protein [Alphaproteobacteria bacterium]